MDRGSAEHRYPKASSSHSVGKPVVHGVTSKYVRPPFASPQLPLDEDLLGSGQYVIPTWPEQVWVCLYGPNYMQVSWITRGIYDSTVDYGLTSGDYTDSATGTNSTYTYDPTGYISGYIHYTVIGPLADDTDYFYILGGYPKEYSFKTPPASGPDVPILFAIVGDLGQTDNTKDVLDEIDDSGYDMLVLPGDLSYADGEQVRWDKYGRVVSKLASSRPWMVTQGNHEKENGAFQAYEARWNMPYTLSGSSTNLYYSFEVAGVHFLMLGSYAAFDKNSDQYAWLKADLKKVDRTKTPWLIAVAHTPWYNSNKLHHGTGKRMKKAMEKLLYDNKVDIMFAGHVHAYERSVRAYNDAVDDNGIIYVTIGDGGNREGLASNFEDPQPAWSAFREASYGHGELQIKDSTTAVWSWHRMDEDENVISDSVEIKSLSAS